MTLGTAGRNAAVDAVVDLIDAGSGAGKLNLLQDASVLATITLKDPAFLAAAAGAAALIGADGATAASPANALTGTGASSGTANAFNVTDSDDTVIFSGTVSEAGGGGEIVLSDTDIVAGQEVRITGLTYTQPAS